MYEATIFESLRAVDGHRVELQLAGGTLTGTLTVVEQVERVNSTMTRTERHLTVVDDEKRCWTVNVAQVAAWRLA